MEDNVLYSPHGHDRRTEATGIVYQLGPCRGRLYMGTHDRYACAVLRGVLMVDIRDLVSLQDVMEELDLGPNGGLVYCFEYPSPPVPASHAPPRCPPLSLTSCRILRLDT